MTRSVRLCQLGDAGVPMLIGLVRPTIILPTGLDRQLTSQQLEAVLVHELQHVARHDAIVHFGQSVLGVIYFFHPLVWLTNRVLNGLREDACDEATVAVLEGHRRDYGAGIVKVAELMSGPTPRMSLGIVESGSQVKRRLRRILDPRLPVGRRLSWSGFAVLLLFAAVLLPVAARPRESASEEPAKRTAAAAEPATPENPKCYVTGLVFEEQTRMPIAGAKLRVLVESEQDPDKRLLQGVSDATGRYRIEVPLGFVRLSVHPKPGYWSADARNLTSLVTSPDKPTLTHDIPVRRGIAWPVQLVVEGGNPDPADFQISVTEVDDEATRAAWLRSENVSFMKSPNSWHSAARRRRHRRAYPVRRNRKAGHHTWRRGNPGHCG